MIGPDDLGFIPSRNRIESAADRLLDLFIQVLFIVIVFSTLFATVGPLLGPGSAAAETQLPDEPVTDCREAPPRPVDENASVVGSVHRVSNDTIEISYQAVNGAPESVLLGVSLPRNGVLVDATGFSGMDESTITLGGGGSLHWNQSAPEHVIQYRMGKGETVSHPSSEQWLLAGTPKHSGDSVHLSMSPDGFVGPNILYLGNYTTVTASEGCQNFTVIVPDTKTSVYRERLVEKRLSEFKVAARSLPLETHYTDIYAFVAPKNLENNVGGYNMDNENEIVVSTKVNKDPSVIWIHEYVHTTQNFRPTPDSVWLVEGTANYFTHRIAVEHGFITPRAYDAWLTKSQTKEWKKSLDKAEIDDEVAYSRGGALLADADQELHQNENGSVLGLFQQLNSQETASNDGLVRYLNQSGVSHDYQIRVQASISSHHQFRLPYLLGPDWLSHWNRKTLGGITHPTAQSLAKFCLGVSILFAVIDRYLKDSTT